MLRGIKLALLASLLLLPRFVLAQNVTPGAETVAATTPVNGCMFFDQGASGGTNTKLCASSAAAWAAAYGFGPLATSSSISAALDTIGSTQGGVLYRGSALWTYLGPGTSGQFLQTQGAGANPLWATAGGGGGSGTVGPGTGPAIAQYGTGTGVTVVGPESVSTAFTNPQGGPLDLATQSVTAGPYTNANVTVNAKGIVTAISSGSTSGGVTSITQGTGMAFSVTPITGTGTINLANTAVTAGSYTNPTITVNAQGQLTAASNGAGAIQSVWTGTTSGGGAYSATTVQGGWTNAANTNHVFHGIIGTVNTGAATLTLDGQTALPIQVQNASGTPLATAGGEITPGAYDFMLDTAGAHFIRLNNPAGTVNRNPASPYALTQADWNTNTTIIFDGAAACAAANTCQVNLPDATTLSAQGGITVAGALLNVTVLAGASDGINGGPIGGSSIGRSDTVSVVTTSHVHGVNAFTAITGPSRSIDMSWLPGQDLSKPTVGVSLAGSYTGPHIVTTIKCTADVPTGASGTATIEFRYAASGTSIQAGTLISTTAAFNANPATGLTEVTLPLSSTLVNIPAGARIGYVAAGTGWSTAGGGSGGISAGAGGCSIRVL